MKILTPRRRIVTHAVLAALTTALATGQLRAQDPAPVARLVAEPAAIVLKAGQVQTFKVRAYDAAGKEIVNPFVRDGRAVRYNSNAQTPTSR